jgi:hypothetical protein
VIEKKAALDDQNELNRKDIELINEQIALYDRMIEEKAQEVTDAIRAEEEQYALYCRRVRAMEETNSWTYLSFLFNANSLTDFLGRLNDVTDIARNDQHIKDEYIAARQAVEQVKAEYEAIQVQQEEHRKELLTEKARLEQERNRNKDPNRSKSIAQEIAALKPEHEITMLISDATPESIADQMQRNGLKMGILDAEAGIFKTLGGQYASNGGTGNIDIIVKAYDGEPHTITRKTSDTVYLPRTALSMGLMIQPNVYDRFIQKADFSENGFTQRFLVSFPEKLDRKFYTPAISDKAKRDYNTVIRRLLAMPVPAEKPIILANQKAAVLFQDYFWHLGKLENELSGSISEQWIDKQYGRCIRIAGLLHMVEHEATEPLDEKTAYSAIQIAKWTETQYLHSTQEIIVDPVIETAKQLYSKIIPFMKKKKQDYFTLTDAKRCIRPDADQTGTKEKIFNSALELMLDACAIEETESTNNRGRKATRYLLAADHARIMKDLK